MMSPLVHHLMQSSSNDRHEKTLIDEVQKLLLDRWMSSLCDGVAKFQRIQKLKQIWYLLSVLLKSTMKESMLNDQQTTSMNRPTNRPTIPMITLVR